MNDRMKSIIYRQFRSITVLVCALALILPMVPIAEATENSSTESAVPETNATVPAETVPGETTPTTELEPTESADEVGESELLAYLRNEVSVYISAYGLTLDMPDNVLAEVFFSLDGERAYAAWSKYDELLPLAMQMSAEEQEIFLSEISTKLVLRFRNVMERAMSPALIVVEPVTVNNVTVEAADASEISFGEGTITISAMNNSSTSCGTTSYSAKAVTITITNAATYAGRISFTYTTDGTVSESSPYTSEALGAGKSIQITFTTDANKKADATTLTLSDLTVTEDNTSYNVTVEYDTGSVTVDGVSVETSGTPVSVPSTGSEFISSDANFLAWINTANNKILSTDATLTPEEFKPTEDTTIRAVSKSGTTAWFRAGGSYLYSDLNAASDYASTASDKTVILMNDGTLEAGTYTIDSGVTLLIPYDDANTLCTTKPTTVTSGTPFVSLTAEGYTKPSVYRTLNMASGANITVNGAMSLSGKSSAIQTNNGSPYGPLSFVNMASGSSITVNSGAFLYAWGYLTGSGSVTVKSGGTVYEDFQVTDWRGGSAANAMLDKEQKVFPVSQYYVQNVEVPMTLEAGAKEFGYMSLVASKVHGETTVPFIGGSGMFRNSGTIIKDYDETTDRLMISVAGDLSMSNLNLEVSSYKMNSANYVLPITNNLSVTVNSGTTTISQDMCMLPGSEIVVAKGASVKLASGVNLYVYDLDEWTGKLFVYSSRDVSPLKYVGCKEGAPVGRTLADAKIVVNGTVDASAGSVYTTTNGANITGSATANAIIGAAGTKTVTYQATQSGTTITFADVSITPAQLKNPDGGYTSTKDTPNATYNYCATHGWYSEANCPNCKPPCEHTSTEIIPGKPATCTETGLTEGKHCSVCGEVIIAQETVDALGHSEVIDAAVSATCTETGLTEGKHCSVCGEVIVAQEEVAALGHKWDNGSVTLQPTPETEGIKTFTCSVCGGTKTEAIPVKVLKISYASMTMANNLDMNFAFEKNQVEDWSGYSVSISKNSDEILTTQEVSFNDWKETTINGIEHYYVTFTGISAKEMTDEIQVKIYKNDKQVSETWTDSVRDQAMRNLESTDKSMTKTMVVDMLNYGAAAQIKLAYKTADLANARLNEEQRTYATQNVIFENSCTQKPETGYYSNIVLGSNLQSVMAFSNSTGISNAQTAEIIFKDHYGSDKSFSLNVSDLEIDENGYHIIFINKTVIADGRIPITCNLKNGNSVIYSVTDSIESYAARADLLDDTNSEICSMLMKFSDSAKTYLHAKALGTLQ